MDAMKFGAFIAQMRKEKEMTQSGLADCLHVTDKAVSRWERGVGFPDIKTLEPLADALGVSILELMKSERLPKEEILQRQAAAALTDAFELARRQRQAERRNILRIFGLAALALLAVFFVDNLGWMFFFGVFVPCLCLAGGIALLVCGIVRRRNRRSSALTFLAAAVLLLMLVGFVALLFLAGVLGLGPVPT